MRSFASLRMTGTAFVCSQTADKRYVLKLDTHGESARGDWLFPLAFHILKNENFFERSHF